MLNCTRCRLEPTYNVAKISMIERNTASSRDVLGNTPPADLEISSGRGFCALKPERLPEGNLESRVYIVPICIIAQPLLMFSTRGCVPDIPPRECIKKYCPLGSISQYSPREQGVYSITTLEPNTSRLEAVYGHSNI